MGILMYVYVATIWKINIFFFLMSNDYIHGNLCIVKNCFNEIIYEK